jgi:RNA polymerase sigma factor (sigma-70 family)
MVLLLFLALPAFADINQWEKNDTFTSYEDYATKMRPRCIRELVKYGVKEHDAEDIVQEYYLAMVKAKGNESERAKGWKYLRQAISYRRIDHYREELDHRRERLVEQTFSPADQKWWKSTEELEALDMIETLTDPYRTVLLMSLAGLTQRQISERLEASPSYISEAYRTAISVLRSRYEKP